MTEALAGRMAGSAPAMAVAAAQRVVMCVFMALRAMSHERLAACRIGLIRHCFEVLVVRAGTVPAEMIELQPVGDSTISKQVGDAMRSQYRSHGAEVSVSLLIQRCFPWPAGIRTAGALVSAKTNNVSFAQLHACMVPLGLRRD